METKVSTKKIVTASVLAFSIVVAVSMFYNNARLKNNLSDEKLKSEILLSEKLSLDKSIVKFHKDLTTLEGKNSTLDKMVADANLKILSKNKEIEKLTAEKVSAKDLQKKINELELLKQKLAREIAELNNSVALANNENKRLNSQLEFYTKKNSGLTSDNSVLKAMISDNYRTEALHGKNEKLTIRARKTNKLLVSFDLPGNAGNNIYFKVVTPQGTEFSSINDLAAAIRITENGDGLLASTSETVAGSAGTKRVEMTFKPQHKLTQGVYQFNVYNDDRFLGSTQLRLK